MNTTDWRDDTKGRRRWLLTAAAGGSAAALLLALTACDGGSATAPGHSQTGTAAPNAVSTQGDSRARDGYAGGGDGQAGTDQVDHRKDPVPLVKGKPLWAANRRHSAEDNAEYHFERDGPDFGARSVDDYVAKAHAFVDAPPASVQTISRSNGDRLLYDAQRNIFAVVSKEGAPRTMFKPRDGAAYWAEQTQREADQAKGKSEGGGQRQYGRRSGADDGGGDG